jgi:hypothetical protein
MCDQLKRESATPGKRPLVEVSTGGEQAVVAVPGAVRIESSPGDVCYRARKRSLGGKDSKSLFSDRIADNPFNGLALAE